MFKLPCFFFVFLWWLLNTFTREYSSKSFRYAQEPYTMWLSFSTLTGPILYRYIILYDGDGYENVSLKFVKF